MVALQYTYPFLVLFNGWCYFTFPNTLNFDKTFLLPFLAIWESDSHPLPSTYNKELLCISSWNQSELSILPVHKSDNFTLVFHVLVYLSKDNLCSILSQTGSNAILFHSTSRNWAADVKLKCSLFFVVRHTSTVNMAISLPQGEQVKCRGRLGILYSTVVTLNINYCTSSFGFPLKLECAATLLNK